MVDFYFFDTGSDHDDNIEMDFNEWKSNLIPILLKILPENIEGSVKSNSNQLIRIVDENNLSKKELSQESKREMKLDFNYKKLTQCKIAKIEQIGEVRQKSDEFMSCMKIDLKLEDCDEYRTAQNIIIYPKNSQKILNRAIEYFGLKDIENQIVLVNPIDLKKKMPFQSGFTLEYVLKNLVEFNGFPRPSFYKGLMKFVNPEQKNMIKEFKDNKKLQEELKSKRFGFIDVLRYLDLKIRIEQFLEISQRIKARYFTIASFPMKNSQMVTIYLSKETHEIEKQCWTGLASSFFCETIKKLKSNEILFLNYKIQNSTFQLPAKKSSALMIGTGTGVSPFLGMIQDKQHNKEQLFDELLLVFGFRKKSEDFLMKKFLEDSKKKGILNNLFPVCSREQKEKFYVQDFLSKNRELLKDVLFKRNDYRVYICG